MKEEKKQRIYKTIMLIVMVAVITFIVTTIFLSSKVGETKYVLVSKGEGTSELASKLDTFKSLIDKVYLGDVDEEKLKEGAIKGYIKGLGDKYSSYYTKEEMEEVEEDTMGNFDGIGVYISKYTDTDEIVVIATIEESVAEKQGILPGDIISKVNGEDCTGMDISVVSSKIRGEIGTNVELEIIRDGKPFNITLTRENIKLNHIKSKILKNNIGYLNITAFDSGCSEEFEEKYNQLKSQGAKSLIIDLRNNGGGIVDEALEIADLIVEKEKTTLITIDKNGTEETEKSSKDPIITEKIVLLVNENTASSSEILAGCLKDYNKATIVGKNTFGKGVIQELMSLKDGSGIKLTTNEYLTPNRNKINEVGIKPDVEVDIPEDVSNIFSIEEEKDTQLQKAIEILK